MAKITSAVFPEKRAFQRSLLRWYAIHQRDLPWRKIRDPYHVLVSEFMLQQTRVETVIPYFNRFRKLFPTLSSLAQAPLPRVLKAWAGLGYYARARNLHAAARIICQTLGGKIPCQKEDLRKLPGFGPYTAGAVASLAFNQPVAAPDGNVKRLLGRIFPDRLKASPLPAEKAREMLLQDLIPARRASDFNQALMDLGAMICIPARPRCSVCPVKKICPSCGEVQGPRPRARKIREETWAVALIEHQGRFLLHRQDGKGLLAGLWKFPTVVWERNGEPLPPRSERRALKAFLREKFGMEIEIKALYPTQDYLFTHIHAAMKPFLCAFLKTAAGTPPANGARWVRPSGFHRFPISTAMRRIPSVVE